MVERYAYGAYGTQTVTNAAGTVELAESGVGQNRGFTGYSLDSETELYFARARRYSATLGRFIGRDQLDYPDGYSLYAAYFVPHLVDPSGLICKGKFIKPWHATSGPNLSGKILGMKREAAFDLPDWISWVTPNVDATHFLLDKWHVDMELRVSGSYASELECCCWLRRKFKATNTFHYDLGYIFTLTVGAKTKVKMAAANVINFGVAPGLGTAAAAALTAAEFAVEYPIAAVHGIGTTALAAIVYAHRKERS